MYQKMQRCDDLMMREGHLFAWPSRMAKAVAKATKWPLVANEFYWSVRQYHLPVDPWGTSIQANLSSKVLSEYLTNDKI